MEIPNAELPQIVAGLDAALKDAIRIKDLRTNLRQHMLDLSQGQEPKFPREWYTRAIAHGTEDSQEFDSWQKTISEAFERADTNPSKT